MKFVFAISITGSGNLEVSVPTMIVVTESCEKAWKKFLESNPQVKDKSFSVQISMIGGVSE